jgi:intracellular sulfur oxidation DsrE/DsrF family protein
MKKFTWILCFFIFCSDFAKAQSSDYKVVFDLTSRDTVNQQAIIRELGLIRSSSPNAQLEVVVYGQGLDLVVQGRTQQETALQKLLAEKGISFKVCAMTMKRNNIDKSQLVPGVEVVPDGIYEIITKQKEGWGYIKVGH